jgi:hypothetical protein
VTSIITSIAVIIGSKNLSVRELKNLIGEALGRNRLVD